MKTIEEFLTVTNKYLVEHGVRPRIVMNNGFSMSAQASKFVYCSPRETGLKLYDSMEVGYPSIVEPLLTEYAEDINCDLTKCIYGWVPCEVINKVIEKHGGINILETFK